MEPTKFNIYQRLAAAMAECTYVQKDKKQGMKYSIVSHDVVTAKVRPVLLKHGIIYHPVNIEFKQAGNRTEVRLDVKFVNIEDPADAFIVPSLGYGIDDQDKGPGKAISYAVKYALLKAMGLETGDDPDQDQDVTYAPDAGSFPGNGSPKSSYAIKKETPERWNEIVGMMRQATTTDDLLDVREMVRGEVSAWPDKWRNELSDEYQACKRDLQLRSVKGAA